MNPVSDTKPKEGTLENRQGTPANFAEGVRRFFPMIFLGVCFLNAWVWRAWVSGSPLLDLMVISVAAITTLLVVNQRLPLQNVVGLVVTIAVFWWATLLVAKLVGVFFFPPLFRFHFFREYEFGIFWVVGLVNARGIVKLILYSWRNSRNYGLWLIALSSLLVTVEDSGARKQIACFAEKFIFVAVIFVSTTPWFIDKQRIDQKPEYQPLLITILLLLW